MLFTVASGYALQALAHMPEDGSFMMAKDLSEQLKLPAPYLANVRRTHLTSPQAMRRGRG